MSKKKYKFDVTIAILNFNRSNFLDRSIRSCIDQISSNKKIEILVIDDNSTDNSMEILKYYENQIEIFKNKKNYGIGYSSNQAIKKSNGKYFIRVDSDDYLNKYAIQIMSDILDFNKDFSFTYADHHRIEGYGIKQTIVKLDTRKKLYKHGAGIMFRTDTIKKIGNYNKKFLEAEDHELLNRLHKKGYKAFRIPIPLYRYYIHKGNISKSKNRIKYEKKV